MNSKDVQIEDSWKKALAEEFSKSYFLDLSEFVRSEYLSERVTSSTSTNVSTSTTNGRSTSKTSSAAKIYPKPQDIFRAFSMCPFDQVKVVILGQDPYHGQAPSGQPQANGLSFAVHEDVPLPPSLKNIFKEIESDTGSTPLLRVSGNNLEIESGLGLSGYVNGSTNGDLSRWATQGVLLLNATLTVRAGQPGSHQKRGWEEFTDAAIRALSGQREHIVFLLWGNYAKQKGAHIDRSKHLVLEAAHPSPFSVHNGFFGCKHFSKTNEYLREHGLGEIDWR